MTMRGIVLVLFTIVFGATWLRADDDLPKRNNFDRYRPLLDHSPFAVATAAAAPAAMPDIFKGLYVANAARTPDGDLVTVMSSDDKNFKEYLSTKQPNEEGYGIASIEWSDQQGATKVTISKDGKFGTLTFNQAFLQTPAMPGAVPPNQLQPMAPMPPPLPPTPAVNTRPGRLSPPQTPHTRPVIQRNPPNAAAQQSLPED